MTTMILVTKDNTVTIDKNTGKLLSFVRNANKDHEMIAQNDRVFSVEYLDCENEFRYINSEDCSNISVTEMSETGAEWKYEFEDLNVFIRVCINAEDEIAFTLKTDSKAEKRFTQIQYPYVTVPYHKKGQEDKYLVWPYNMGYLIKNPIAQDLRPDCAHTFKMVEENGTLSHYCGRTMAQFLGYYDALGGIILMVKDCSGYVKQIIPVDNEAGIRFAVSHVGDISRVGDTEIPYEVVLKSFKGDWYDCADVYRNWSDKQPWAQKTLTDKNHIPKWLIDSPVFLMIRLKGETDFGPAYVNDGFVPLENLTDKINKISKRINGGILPVLMGWEKGGPWVYPECFPPVGGDEGFSGFAKDMTAKGFKTGTYSNGTRFVTEHFWAGYDGKEYYKEKNGEIGVCRTNKGEPWKQDWDVTWRPSYNCCIAEEQTQKTALDYVQHVIDWGFDWIQFF